MPVSAAERRYVLDNLTRLAEADINKLWRAAELQSDVEFAAYVTQAFPELVDPYHQIAAEAGATFFESDFPAITVAAIVAPPLPTEKLTTSAQWALDAYSTEAIGRLAATAQRAIYDGERDTTALNARRNGMRWVRVARPDACAFCRMLAARTVSGTTYYGSGVQDKIDPETKQPYADGRKTTVVYGSNSARPRNAEYHNHCHCTAQAIPNGVDPMEHLSSTEPQFADLAAQWESEYRKAAKAAKAAGAADPTQILSKWREHDPTAR